MATDEDIAGNPEAFDCEGCAVAHALAAMDTENAEAWRLFPVIYSRLCVDVPGIASAVLAAVTAEMTPDDVADLIRRLNIIYDVMVPPKTH